MGTAAACASVQGAGYLRRMEVSALRFALRSIADPLRTDWREEPPLRR